SESNSDSYTDTYSYSDCNGDTDTYFNAYSYTHGHSYTDAKTYPNSEDGSHAKGPAYSAAAAVGALRRRNMEGKLVRVLVPWKVRLASRSCALPKKEAVSTAGVSASQITSRQPGYLRLRKSASEAVEIGKS